MSAVSQIILGSIALCICAIWHIWVLLTLIKKLHKYSKAQNSDFQNPLRITILIFLVILFSHTIQFYFWASTYWLMGGISAFQDAIYFSLVTYTTLGYGDIILAEGFRTLAAMEAVTGVLVFGISTAFLVGYFAQLMPRSS